MFHHRLKFRQAAMLIVWLIPFKVAFDCPLARFIKALWLIHVEWWAEQYLPARYRDARWLPTVEPVLGSSELFDAYFAVACALGVAGHARDEIVRDRYQHALDALGARPRVVGTAWALLLTGLDQGFLRDRDYATLQNCLGDTVSRRRATRWLDRIDCRTVDRSSS
jgi:hypothetical protein